MRMALIAALSVIAVAPALAPVGAPPAQAQEGGGHGGGMARLKAADANHDGAITRAEMRATRATMFERMDANSDGFITQAEREAMADAAQARGKSKRPEGAGGGPGPGGGGERGLERADTNNDGKISRDEFVNGPMPMFDRLDANKNGTIEATELESARAMMARRKQVTP